MKRAIIQHTSWLENCSKRNFSYVRVVKEFWQQVESFCRLLSNVREEFSGKTWFLMTFLNFWAKSLNDLCSDCFNLANFVFKRRIFQIHPFCTLPKQEKVLIHKNLPSREFHNPCVTQILRNRHFNSVLKPFDWFRICWPSLYFTI